ncbi:MAG: hypothetical protein ACKOTH_05860 [Solirubrobacterales bacterium]
MGEAMQICSLFLVRVGDVDPLALIFEITGTNEKIEAFEQMLRPLGMVEMMRTGEIAIARGRAET